MFSSVTQRLNDDEYTTTVTPVEMPTSFTFVEPTETATHRVWEVDGKLLTGPYPMICVFEIISSSIFQNQINKNNYKL